MSTVKVTNIQHADAASPGITLASDGTVTIPSIPVINSTDDVSEGSNLYYTDERADGRIAAASIDDLSDVDTTTASPSDLLAYDGSAWAPSSEITVDGIQFDVAAALEAEAEGEVVWDTDAGTLDLMMNSGVLLHVGQETFVRVKNQTGGPLAKGDLLAYDGTVGISGVLKAKKAVADGSEPSKLILGVAAAAIADGDDGYAIQQGRLTLDTTVTDWVAEDILWADPSVAGGLTRVEPASPNLRYAVAVVVSLGSSGRLYVRLSPGKSLAEDELVTLSSPQDGDVLAYNDLNSRFENVALTASDVGALPSTAGLDDLNDVSASAPSTDDVLAFDGTNWVPDSDIVRSTDVTDIVVLTQAAYDLLTPDANTFYIIVG